MEVSSHLISEYNTSFNGLRKSKNRTEVTKVDTPATEAAVNSGKVYRSYIDAGLFTRAKLHLNKIFNTNINNPIVKKINGFEQSISKLSDEELQNKTIEFKERLAARETSADKITDIELEKAALDEILPEAYAVVRETAKRVLGKRPRDVQMLAGIAIHNSQIAEMMTGEGKTLAATMPAYLNALTGKGVHIITTNDYLAKRDSEQMGKIFNALGLSVGLVTSDNDDKDDKKVAYNADITYGTSSVFGFDYMKDNMAKSLDQKVQRPYNFAIIDEADSVLIDEAVTPLIISGLQEKPDKLCYKMAQIASHLEEGPDKDYEADEEEKTITLTEKGMSKAEELLGVEDLYNTDSRNAYRLLRALKAKEFFHINQDYVIKDGEIVIVDEFTGRSLEGRKWSDGIHQAIQAKENLEITSENQTIASITIQNLLKLYPRISGMTGTAYTEKDELNAIYHLEVNEIPTNLEVTTPDKKKTNRIDYVDRIYKTEQEKDKAIIEEIIKVHNEGRPVLVGTTSVERSEHLSRILAKYQIDHKVLNAKHAEEEALIIAQAGRKGAVTIATNMAGRGTDIELGGNAEYLTQAELKEKNITPENTPNYDEIRKSIYDNFKNQTDEEGDDVKARGGLHVIGTEKHESRRIDNQLRGRAARQGDPGSTVFFVSLEDELIRLIGGEEIAREKEALDVAPNTPIDSKRIEKLVSLYQRIAESQKFQARKNTNDYDNIMNMHRQKVYEQRNRVLTEKDLTEEVTGMIGNEVNRMLERNLPTETKSDNFSQEELSAFIEELHSTVPQLSHIGVKDIQDLDFNSISEKISKLVTEAYKAKKASFQKDDVINIIEKNMLLNIVDRNWSEYLYQIDMMREGIGLVAIGGKNPIEEFRNASFDIFAETMDNIQNEIIRSVFSMQEKTPAINRKIPKQSNSYIFPIRMNRKSIA